jgi:O-antigen ligase
MPEHLRALLVILVLASLVFAYVQRSGFGILIAADDLRRRRNLWFGITLLAFLAHNFSIYIVGAVILVLAAKKFEKNPLAIFVFLLFAVPPFSAPISGIGEINKLFEINQIRLLSLAILLPAWFSLRRNKSSDSFGAFWPDRFVICYILLRSWSIFSSTTFTDGLREAVFYQFIDVFLPYYVASRGTRNILIAKDVISSLVISCFILSLVGIFELFRHWLLYSSLSDALGLDSRLGGYLGRGDLGVVRAYASTGHSLALGYVLAIAFLLYQFVQPRDHKSISNKLGALVILAGLGASISRGPWLGMAVGIILFTLMSKTRSRDLNRLLIGSFLGLVLIIVSPYRDRVIDLIPFVGTTDAGNVDYRIRLFEASLAVIGHRPWFGGGDFYNQLASMGLMQGEGIVDLVNSYIGIALSQGLVGLALFLGVFVAAGVSLFRAWTFSEPMSDAHLLGRSLLSALVAMLFIISTVSSILCIPTLYWMLAGLCMGCSRFIGQRSL